MTASTPSKVYRPRLQRRVTVRVLDCWSAVDAVLNALRPMLSLMARLYVAQVFFASGLTKLRDWGTTVALFTDEYHVPLLSPEVAAILGTGGELVLPVLLVAGLGGPFAALGLSVVNGVAVVALAEIAPAALQLHITWGVLLAALAVFGSGRWSLDTPLRAWMARP